MGKDNHVELTITIITAVIDALTSYVLFFTDLTGWQILLIAISIGFMGVIFYNIMKSHTNTKEIILLKKELSQYKENEGLKERVLKLEFKMQNDTNKNE